MGKRKQILDHGYLELVDIWGSDERVIEAARMSTGKGFLGWGPLHSKECQQHEIGTPKQVHAEACCDGQPGDEKLLRYLWTNKHHTPFEMAGMTIEVMAPIMVFREWHRHRTQSYNEMSARYTPLPDVNYLPTAERCLVVAGGNKQAQAASGSQALTHESVLEWLVELEGSYQAAESTYQSGLKRGVPKELARLCVPVGRYSRMRASAVLRNWLAFLTLRMDKAAQWEIRQFANGVGELIAQHFPKTWTLFVEGRNV